MPNPSHSRRILGVDPGSLATGIGIIEGTGSRIKPVHWEVIQCPGKEAFPKRLQRIHQGIHSVIERFDPTEMALEDIFFSVNPKSTIKLGQTRGVILLASAELGVPLHEYTPLEVKQTVVGHGRADKKQVQTMVTNLLALKERPHPFDASDALAIAICHLNLSATKMKLEQAGA